MHGRTAGRRAPDETETDAPARATGAERSFGVVDSRGVGRGDVAEGSDQHTPAAPVPATPGRIVLVRHGKPSLARDGSYDAPGWDDWWSRYNRAGLADGEAPPEELRRIASGSAVLLASPLPRARETAEALAEGREIIFDKVFVEAPLPAPPIPGFLKFDPNWWGFISRSAWLMGFSGGQESHREAKVRAERAADRVVEEAASGGDVLVCAHGWFNRMVRGVLRRRGWRCTRDGGDRYWSWRRFER